MIVYLHLFSKNRKNFEVSMIKNCKKILKRYVTKWLSWRICRNHLGRKEVKHHKSILYDDFMHLSIDMKN